jgi:hypothetical protein
MTPPPSIYCILSRPTSTVEQGPSRVSGTSDHSVSPAASIRRHAACWRPGAQRRLFPGTLFQVSASGVYSVDCSIIQAHRFSSSTTGKFLPRPSIPRRTHAIDPGHVGSPRCPALLGIVRASAQDRPRFRSRPPGPELDLVSLGRASAWRRLARTRLPPARQ